MLRLRVAPLSAMLALACGAAPPVAPPRSGSAAAPSPPAAPGPTRPVAAPPVAATPPPVPAAPALTVTRLELAATIVDPLFGKAGDFENVVERPWHEVEPLVVAMVGPPTFRETFRDGDERLYWAFIDDGVCKCLTFTVGTDSDGLRRAHGPELNLDDSGMMHAECRGFAVGKRVGTLYQRG